MKASDSVAARGPRPFVGVNAHRILLKDKVRTLAFQRAIEALVKPGMRVLDLGTGSGVLAMMAARAGAEHVVAVDVEPIAHLAARLAEANGLAEKMTFHVADSRTLAYDGHFDLVVSECMGNFFVTDEMQLALRDARRMLKPNGRFCPSRVDLFVAPVFFPQLNEVGFWRDSHYGFDFGPVVDTALQQCYVHHVPPELLMGPPAPFRSIDFMDMQQDLSARLELPIERNITLHGLCGWFDAQLSDDVLLSTAPSAEPTHWAQSIFPLAPLAAQKGDVLHVDLSIGHDGDVVRRVTWNGTLQRAGQVVAQFDHDTDRRFVR